MWPSIAVVLLRLIVPLSIMRWPLAGGIAAIVADVSDVFILEKCGWGLFAGESYHLLDKLLDTYYLALECRVALRWKDVVAGRVAFALFAFRLGGVIAFEATGLRWILLAAPNVFENFYLIWMLLPRLRPRLGLVLAIAAVPKFAQEYLMHYRDFATWEYVRDELFYWIF